MNPTWAELSVCARAQVAVRYEVNGRGRYRLLSHNMVLLNAQPAPDSLPRECFNLQLATQNRKSIITHVTCAEAGRGESGPARQHAHVLPSVHCSRERERGQFVDRGAAATLVITFYTLYQKNSESKVHQKAAVEF